MRATRRDALLFAALAKALSAQSGGGDLILRNRVGLEVRPIGDPNRPTIAISLPDTRGVNAVVIELPEHAWRRKVAGAEPEWFYRMYTSESRYMGRATWIRKGDALRYSMELRTGIELAGTATLQSDGLLIEYEIGNPEDTAFVEVQAPTCIKLYRPFTDVFLERTYVHHADGLDLLASETPERLTRNAEEWLPCRYIVRSSQQTVPPQNRIERQADGITRYHKLRPADAPFIATGSSLPGWVAATHALSGPSVWTNPARTCHHTDVSASWPARSSAKLALKFYLFRGTVEDAWRRAAKQRQSNTL